MPVTSDWLEGRCSGTSKGRCSFVAPQRVPGYDLVPLEVRVLSVLARGLSTKEVAQILDTSIRTVAYHKFRLMERHALRTTEDLVAFAVAFAKETGLDAL